MSGFYVGHGRHWQFYFQAGREEDLFLDLLGEVYANPASRLGYRDDAYRMVHEPDRELAVALLLEGDEVASAFPYVAEGHLWPIDIQEWYQWPNEREGQLIGSCHGARVAFFDTHYGQHREFYPESEGALDFSISALAYAAGRTEFESEEDAAKFADSRIYLPFSGEGASEDEVQFLSQVEAVRELSFHGVPFDVYTITLALPEDFPLRLNLYTPRVITEETLAVGDPISGVCWLFGQLRQKS